MIDIHPFQESELCIRNVTIISGYRPAGRAVDHRKKCRSDHGLFFVLDGEARFSVVNGPSMAVHPGELLYIPAGCCYKMQYTAPATGFVLVNLDMLTAKGENTFLADQLTLLAKDDSSHHIFRIMVNFERCSAESGPAASFRKKELVYKLLGAVFAENGPLTLEDPKYAAILPGTLMLQQTYLENIPITKFAEVCNISVTSFRSLFTKKYGLSPLQYRNQLRINRAIALLQEGSCTVAEAAYASGFDNLGYFCRYYKKITGETPRTTQARSV